jgi:hypothetical protein
MFWILNVKGDPGGGGGLGGTELMVNVKVVVWDREPAMPVTVIVDDPAGVDAEVVRVNVDEHVGLHDPGEKEAVAPVGRPEAERDTDCAVPETSVAAIVLDADWPWTTVWFPPLETEKSKGGGAFTVTVNVRVVVWDREPATPVTVIVDDPAGVDAEVVRVNVDEHVGLHVPGENAAVAPAGRPEAEKDSDCAVPETRVAVIGLATDWPATTVTLPPTPKVKSKGGGGGGGVPPADLNAAKMLSKGVATV